MKDHPPRKSDTLLGVGLGVGMLGALALALRYGFRKSLPERLPDSLSPADFATRVCQTSQAEIVFHVSGQGSPLVFLHHPSIGASSFEWARVYPSFAATHEVFAPDLPGFGESERPRRCLHPEDFARSLADFLHLVSPRVPATIVGSGLAGGLAVLLASKHPELVSRLLLVSPVARPTRLSRIPGIPRLGVPRALRGTTYRNHYARLPYLRSALARELFAFPETLPDDVIHAYSTCALQYGAEHAILHLSSGRWILDLSEVAVSETVPVTILRPALLAGLPADAVDQTIAALRPRAVQTLPEAGFLAAIDQPEAVVDWLRTELAGGLRSVQP